MNINTPEYWNTHQTATDFGLRQEKYLEMAGTGNRIIELGCGRSPFADAARINFTESYGLDFSPETIENCKKIFPQVNYILGEATDTPFKDKYFDVVVAGELIEHLEEPEKLIKEMARIGKKLILSTPILEFYEPEHLHEFTQKDLIKMLSPYGKTEVKEIKSGRFPGRRYLFAECEISSKV